MKPVVKLNNFRSLLELLIAPIKDADILISRIALSRKVDEITSQN